MPIQQNLPYSPDSGHWLERVRDLGGPVWLDSAHPFSTRGRYDIISAAPLTTLRAAAGQGGDPFDAVREALRAAFDPTPIDAGLPFSGGAIGLFGYNLGRQLEGFAPQAAGPDFPDLMVGLYSWAIVSDHQQRRTALVIRPETPAALRHELLRRTAQAQHSAPDLDFRLESPWREEFGADNYRRAFERLQDYIRAGDCYQVNLARRFSARFSGDPWAAYRRLRAVAAAPFSAYMECADGALLCLSPERFLAAERNQLLTQPIKGTAPRDADPDKDRALADALRASDKNRAENLMIVDLLRNDLGRSCTTGSIRVDQLFELQSFATVHHLVSSVRGELRPDLHPLDALRHGFPGGSITGAPKIRAMQIIDELEPAARSVFCGSLGYIGCDGRMDTNITIRTLLACRGELYAWAGGGIVADSDCAEEFEETRSKIEPLLRALMK